MKRLFWIAPLVMAFSAPIVFAQEKWQGIDESVLEKFAEDRGRAATEPFLGVEGDLLLFLFALAGAIGGFIVGYYWHKVFVAQKKDHPE